jgi:hypothetical protein
MTENKSDGDRPADGGSVEPPTSKPGEIRPAQGDYIEHGDGRKGIVVMPVSESPIDVQNLAPSGPPAPQQAAPADAPPPPSSES